MEDDNGGVLTQTNSAGFDILYRGVVHALLLSCVSKDVWLSPLVQMHAPLASALSYAANCSASPSACKAFQVSEVLAISNCCPALHFLLLQLKQPQKNTTDWEY